jgi:hypothetical protein
MTEQFACRPASSSDFFVGLAGLSQVVHQVSTVPELPDLRLPASHGMRGGCTPCTCSCNMKNSLRRACRKSFHMSAASRRGPGAGERRLPFARTAVLRGEAR